jgi:hypothetical protein
MAQSRPFRLIRLFTKTGLISGAAALQGLRSLERCWQHDGCNSPERKMKLRSGEDGEFSNN